MKNLPLLTILVSFSCFAFEEKVMTFDLNNDGKADRFEYQKKDRIVRIEEDRNGDLKIDHVTILDDQTYHKIELQDTDANGKFDRKKSYLAVPDQKTKVITELDKNSDGVFELKHETFLDNTQEQADCSAVVNAQITKLSTTVIKAVSKTSKGLVPTGLGFKVDVACYDKWGADFNRTLKEMAVEGLQCLRNLDKQGRVGNSITGALRNAFELTRLMRSDGISLVCSEEAGYDWSKAVAHASINKEGKMTGKHIAHPFISLNPRNAISSPEARTAEIYELKNTLFHEAFHNLGYAHHENLEFSYTCGLCCFGKDSYSLGKELACKICTGNYTNETDLNYVKDMIEYSYIDSKPHRGLAAVRKYMKENPKSKAGIAMLAFITGRDKPIGSALAELVRLKLQGFTLDDEEFLKRAIYVEGYEADYKLVKASSSVVATALYELYHNRNGVEAINALAENKALIREELEKLRTARKNGIGQYVATDMMETINTIIKDMWLHKYPGDGPASNPVSDQAFQLWKYFQENSK